MANLSKQNNKLLVNKNPQAKTQYLDQLRNDLNISKKEVIKLQEENKAIKRKEDQSSKRLQSIPCPNIRQFCNNICKIVDIPQVKPDSEAIINSVSAK